MARRSRPRLRAVVPVALLLALGAGPAAATPTPTPLPTPAPTSAPPLTPAPSPTPDPAPTDTPAPADPLEVRIDSLTPSALTSDPGAAPRAAARALARRVVVTGTVRNTSTEDWGDLAVYLVTSAAPITTSADLEAAVASDPQLSIGDRVVEPGAFDEVGDLAPGAATRFQVAVPRSLLGIGSAPGVYWLGVHVLGTGTAGRDTVADGRARTFVPLVPDGARTELALGLQLRGRAFRSADGRLADPGLWRRTFDDDGRLRRLLRLTGSAGDYPLTWVVDAAVVDAARSVAAGDPVLDLRPGEPGAGRSPAGRWLRRFAAEAQERPVLALPYGDLDVSAAVTGGHPGLVGQALTAAEEVLDRLGRGGIAAAPAVVPLSGFLAPDALLALPSDVLPVLNPAAVPSAAGAVSAGRAPAGRILLVPGATADEGPAPTPVRSALSVRQRLLADAALNALSPNADRPLVRLLPAGWDPGRQWRRSDFFAGLAVDWLGATTLPAAAAPEAGTGPAVVPDSIDPATDVLMPETEVAAALPEYLLGAAEDLAAGGVTLGEVLVDNPGITDEVARLALQGASLWNRARPRAAVARVRGTQAAVQGWLGRITVRSPAFVALSGDSGTLAFQVTLANGLDEPVVAGLQVGVTDRRRLQLSVPDPVRLPPGGRAAMRVRVRAEGIGVHNVSLEPVSVTGTPLGAVTALTVRSSRVGVIVWAVLGTAIGLLGVAVVLRIVRRVRQRKATHGPQLRAAAR